MNHLLIVLAISVAAAGSWQRPQTKSSPVGGLAPGQGGCVLGRLQTQGAVPGNRSVALWEKSGAGLDLGQEQCESVAAVQFCGSFKGGADHLGGADVGAGVLQAYCFNFGGCHGGEDLVELALFQGGQSDISADYLDNGMLVGPDGGLADALWLLEGSDVLECYDGEVLVELELLHGGLPDSYAGDLDIDVLGGLGGGLTEEQQLLADFDKIEGLDGDPPDPGGGACGLRWRVCPLAAWRHGPRGMGSDDGPAEERRLLGDSDALEGCVGGVLGHDLLEDFDGGLTEGQKLLEDFGEIEAGLRHGGGPGRQGRARGGTTAGPDGTERGHLGCQIQQWAPA